MKELTVTGNVGGDPVVRTSLAGKEFINFSVAHYEGKTKDGNEIPSTWVDIMLSSDSFLAPYVMNNVKKGVKILVKGRNKISAYTTKQGVIGYTETIYPDKIEAFSFENKTTEASDVEQANNVSSDNTVDNAPTDDIPFQS